MVLALVLVFFKGIGKHGLRLPDLHANFGQIGQFQRCAVFVNQRFDIKAIVLQVIVLDIEIFLRKIKSLMNKVGITVVHQRLGSLHVF
jgi:hypothetical protein